MKNRKTLIVVFALALIVVGCKKDKPKEIKDEKSVVIKSDEEIYDENQSKDFYDLINTANKDLSEEEKTFLARVLKDIENKDAESLSEILGEPLKSEVGGDLRILADKLIASDYSGEILSINKVTKNDKTFLIVAQGDNDSLVTIIDKDKDKLSKLDIKLLSTVSKNKKLKNDNQAYVDRAHDIIKSLRNEDKDSFKSYVKGLNLKDEEIEEMYDGLRSDLDMAGKTLTDNSKVKVSYAKDLIKTAPIDQNLINVTLISSFEHIEKIVYDFVFTEDMNLIALEVGADEK